MNSGHQDDSSRLLVRLAEGDRGALDALLPLVYEELRQMARVHLSRSPAWSDLSSGDLVSKAYLKLAGDQNIPLKGRSHFFALSARVMRQLLVDHARERLADKREGSRQRVPLSDQTLSPHNSEHVLAVDAALERLGQLNPRYSGIVEMRFFGGMTVEEVAAHLGVSKRSVEADWTIIRAWLRRELSGTMD